MRAPRPPLSFCIVTRGPAERVRGLLAYLRPHVDEIVLAVDRRAPDEVLAAGAPLADRRLTFEVHESASWLTGWILHQCSGDWILRLDDDEVPSRTLLEALPELVRDRYPTAIELRRRWLYPTPASYISTGAWATEWQTRLLRNVPGQWRFDGRVHTDVDVRGELRLVDLPFYHLDLALQEPGERRRKSLAYEGLRPGLDYNDFPVNGLYLPEAVAELETAATPEADRRAIEAVLAGAVDLPAEREPAPVEAASAHEVGRYNSHRTVSPGAYRATIEFVHPAPVLAAGALHHHEIFVHNRGDEIWPAGDGVAPLIRVGYRWLDGISGQVVRDGRDLFPETVRPGQRIHMRMFAPAPVDPGEYVLEVDLVHEHVRWFDCATRLPVTVCERPRAPLIERSPDELGASDVERRRLRALEDRARADAEDARRAVDDFKRTRRYRLARALGRVADSGRRLIR